MALALVEEALLITDDVKMAFHARNLGIKTLLLREASGEEIQVLLQG